MTAPRTLRIGGQTLLILDETGPAIGGSERDAGQLVGDALGAEADVVVVPVQRLHPEFLRLRTRIAGEFAQKFTNYHRRLVILGPLEAALADSEALRDYVRESNRGGSVWFVADQAELERRLQGV